MGSGSLRARRSVPRCRKEGLLDTQTAVLRVPLIPTWLATALIATAALLLFYNEQTALVLLAIALAGVCVVLGVNLLLRRVESSGAIGSVAARR